jgi:hypothetical protein
MAGAATASVAKRAAIKRNVIAVTLHARSSADEIFCGVGRDDQIAKHQARSLTGVACLLAAASSASGPASSRRATGDVVRQAPPDRPLLRPKPIGPLNRAGPVSEVANAEGVTVHEPQGPGSARHRVDHGLGAATVPVPHSPHDRRRVIGAWQGALRHAAVERGKARTIHHQSRITGNRARHAPQSPGLGRIKVLRRAA